MLDTMKNSQILENNREAELLRQQEAFINQNRMHIEKRRRSREYSPEREYRERDRERERSYSPPRRRERDGRKTYPSFRENRARRADSRDREHPDAKKKRNDGDINTDKNDAKVSITLFFTKQGQFPPNIMNVTHFSHTRDSSTVQKCEK